MPRLIAILLLPLLALTACATPQARLQTGLRDAGLSPRMSACMADYMVDRLSLVQLRRISALASLKDADYGRMTMDKFLNKVRALKDTEILAVSSKAVIACAIDI